MKKLLSKLSIPHVFIFLSAIILFTSFLTYIIPSGRYERTTKTINNIERTVVIPGTYQQIPKQYSVKGLILGDEVEGKATPTSLLGLFSAIPKGLNQAASLIFAAVPGSLSYGRVLPLYSIGHRILMFVSIQVK